MSTQDTSRHPNRKVNLDRLASDIRAAGFGVKKGVSPHKTPEQPLVHAAYKEGHIDLEQAKDLNPKYDPSKRYNKKPTADFKAQRAERKVTGKPPSMLDTHEAVVNRKVSFDEAVELNSNYGNKNKRNNVVNEANRTRGIKTPVPSYKIPFEYKHKDGE
jgi:hypothetical protein